MFLLVCVYLLTERRAQSLDLLTQAVTLDPTLLDDILVADSLSYVRLQAGFAEFKQQHYLDR